MQEEDGVSSQDEVLVQLAHSERSTTLVDLICTKSTITCSIITLVVIIMALLGFMIHYSNLCDDSGQCENTSATLAALVSAMVVVAIFLFGIISVYFVRQERWTRIQNGELQEHDDLGVHNTLVRKLVGIKTD